MALRQETGAPANVEPVWDLADRLGKALRIAGMGVQEMADYLGMHRNSLSRWLSGKAVPDRRTLLLWSLRTGVTVEWLETGVWAPWDSNPQPTDYGQGQVIAGPWVGCEL